MWPLEMALAMSADKTYSLGSIPCPPWPAEDPPLESALTLTEGGNGWL